MSAKEIGDLGFRHQRLGRPQCQINKFFIGRVQRQVVDIEEDQRRFESDSFVAVDERVALNDVLQVSGRHLEEIDV